MDLTEDFKNGRRPTHWIPVFFFFFFSFFRFLTNSRLAEDVKLSFRGRQPNCYCATLNRSIIFQKALKANVFKTPVYHVLNPGNFTHLKLIWVLYKASRYKRKKLSWCHGCILSWPHRCTTMANGLVERRKGLEVSSVETELVFPRRGGRL